MDCDGLQVFVRYNIRKQVKSEAWDSFCTTIFTCIIMCIGSIMFSSDTERIVIIPITKMVGIIRMLADDPLQKRDAPVFSDEEINSKVKNELKTVEL